MSNTRIAEELAEQLSNYIRHNTVQDTGIALIQTALDTQRAEFEREHGWQPIETAPRDGTWVEVKGRDFTCDDGYAVVPDNCPEYSVLAQCVLPDPEDEGFDWRTPICLAPVLRPTHWRPAAPETIKSQGV